MPPASRFCYLARSAPVPANRHPGRAKRECSADPVAASNAAHGRASLPRSRAARSSRGRITMMRHIGLAAVLTATATIAFAA